MQSASTLQGPPLLDALVASAASAALVASAVATVPCSLRSDDAGARGGAPAACCGGRREARYLRLTGAASPQPARERCCHVGLGLLPVRGHDRARPPAWRST